MSDYKLVYSSDPTVNKKCSKCKELISECTCKGEEEVTNFKGPVVLRIEKAGRGGKIVTVISRFPRNTTYLKNMCGTLKKKCGVGGSFSITDSGGVIEIQGDKKELLMNLLAKENISCKG